MSKEAVKEEVKGGPCGSCKWWDTGTTREFHRDGIRKGLCEIRSICRSPSSKAKGHLTAKPSVRPCFEKGTFIASKKEEQPLKPKKFERKKKEKKSKVEVATKE